MSIFSGQRHSVFYSDFIDKDMYAKSFVSDKVLTICLTLGLFIILCHNYVGLGMSYHTLGLSFLI